MITEKLNYSNYEIESREPSKLVSGEYTTTYKFACPRCHKIRWPLSHGVRDICVKCGLKFVLFGNALEVTGEEIKPVLSFSERLRLLGKGGRKTL